MSIENFALSRSIREAAAFFEIAPEVRIHGIEVEQCNGYQKVVGLRHGYSPSDEWQTALWALYVAISDALTTALSDDDYRYQDGSTAAWLEARNSSVEEPWGWIHRIILLINHARRINHVEEDMGDPEFYLMKKVVSDRLAG